MVISGVNTVTYNGNGITTAWPYTFQVTDDSEIRVQLNNADGTAVLVDSDFYVDLVNSTVYYPGYAPGSEPPEAEQPPKVQTGQTITVYREIPITQEANLGDKWPFNVIEKGLDKLTMICQQIYSYTNRKLDDALASMELLADVVVDSDELQHITDQLNTIDDKAEAAADSAEAAAESEANALSYKNDASSSATAASGSAMSAASSAAQAMAYRDQMATTIDTSGVATQVNYNTDAINGIGVLARNNDIYQPVYTKLDIVRTETNYVLNDDGTFSVNTDYDVRAYKVYTKTNVYVKASKFVFSTSAYINHNVGSPVVTPTNGMVTVPDTAAYILVNHNHLYADDIEGVYAVEPSKNAELAIYSFDDITFTDGVTDYLDISKYQNKYIGLVSSVWAPTDDGIQLFDENKNRVFLLRLNYFQTVEQDARSLFFKIIFYVPSNCHYIKFHSENYTITAKLCRVFYPYEYNLIQSQKNPTMLTIPYAKTIFPSDYDAGSGGRFTVDNISSAWETNAETCYANMRTYMQSNDGCIPFLFMSDPHFRGWYPMAWINKRDKSVKAVNGGDNVIDKYATKEMDFYVAETDYLTNYLTAIGNHEVNYGTESMSQQELVETYGATNRRIINAKGNYVVDDDEHNCRWLVINPFQINVDKTSNTCRFTHDDAEAVNRELLSANGRNIIVVIHIPFIGTLVDRNGNDVTISGPYTLDVNVLKTMILAFNARTSGTAVGAYSGMTFTYDYTNVSGKVLCVLSGHVHAEGTSFSGIREYAADNFTATGECCLAVADPVNEKLVVWAFDSTQTLAKWELNLFEA